MSDIVSINGYTLHMHDDQPMVGDLELAERLGYSQPRDIRKLVKRLLESGRVSAEEVRATVARMQNGTTSVSYHLGEKATLKVIVKSETEKADQITDEIIDVFIEARTGKTPVAELSRMDILKLAMESEQENLRLTQENKLLESEVVEMAPKVAALDRIATSDGGMCITDAAKDLQMRPKDLFKWLQSHRWIYKRPGNGSWLGYQERVQAHLLEHKTTTVERTDGSEKVVTQVRVTPKGLVRLSEACG